MLRPRTLGEHRVAVVLSTNTWQAYNFLDANGDGWGDSWYVGGASPTVDLSRPFLDFGVPFRFKDWDLSFISWLSRTGKQVDFLTDDDLERFASGDALRHAYDLVVFPGHEEYVSGHAYDVATRYRDLGGNLMFLSANNFFWKVTRAGHTLRRVAMWRSLGKPEASLVGVQWAASNYGTSQSPYVVQGAAGSPWAFAGTGLQQRLVVRALRDRDRLARAELAGRDAAAGADPERDRLARRRDDLLRVRLWRAGVRRGLAQLRGLDHRAGRLAAGRERLGAASR